MASAGRLRFARAGTLTPALQNVTDTFGAWTTPSRGGVRLNGEIGFIVSGTPTIWKIRMKPGGGTAGHWVFPGSFDGTWWVVSEGMSALTPMPSVTGRASKLSDGTYTFEIIGANAFGDSPAVEFTRTIDPNATTIGNALGGGTEPTDYFGGASVATFEGGTTIGQRKLLLAKGIESRDLLLQGFEFTSEVVMRDADPAVPSDLIQIWLFWIHNGAWTRFITIDGVGFDNDTLSSSTRFCKVLINKVSDLTFKNMEIGKTVASQNINLKGLVCEGFDCERIIIEDCTSRWLQIGFTISGTDNIVRRCLGRWLHARVVSILDSTNLLVEDITVMSWRYIAGSGLHPEGIQRNDGAVIDGMTIRRIRMYAADATYGAQGMFMGNTATNSKNVQIYAIAFAGWLSRGISQATCEGTNRMRNFTLVKANTGDETNAPFDCRFTTDGPWVTFFAASAPQWVGTYDVDHGYVGDRCFVEPIPPDPSFAAPNYDATTMRVRNKVYVAGDFLNGNPSVNLPAITFSQWEAMSDDDVIAAFDAALIPGANLSNADYVTGAFLADGSWNENA